MAQGLRLAHLPELRFALGEPQLDTTKIDNSAHELEAKAFFPRKLGTDGYRFGFQPTLKKVVADRRASLDEEEDIRKPMLKLIREEFKRGATLPVLEFPTDGTPVPDSPRLTLVVVDPDTEWNHNHTLERNLAEWTKKRGDADRSYPGTLIWCVKKPGRALREKVDAWQAWKKVEHEINTGVLAGEFETTDRAKVKEWVKEAAEDAQDSAWADYTFIFIADRSKNDGIEKIDLGAGHSSEAETLCGRVITALKQGSLLNESIGVGYLERRWPEALKESGAWPLSGLRQSFLPCLAEPVG
jgi:hypothetical protein